MPITRRQFLKRTAVTTAGLATFGPRLRWLPGTNVSYAAGPSDAIVVFVRLYGGNDGVNMVYPVGNPNNTATQRHHYEQFRPTLKLPNDDGQAAARVAAGGPGSSTLLSLGANPNGETYALHPAMVGLHQLYGQNKVAVVSGVHYPFADHSHFRSEAIYYTVDPEGTGGLGWFGKYLDYAAFTPTEVPGIIVGDELIPIFTPTQTSLLAFNRLSELRFPATGETNLKQATFRNLYNASGGLSGSLYPEAVKIGQTGVATVDKIQDYFQVGSGVGKVEALLVDGGGDYDPGNPLIYSSPLNDPALADMSLAQDLKHVAATIRADVGARFFHVAVGGYDSHTNQENGFYHSFLLQELSQSIAAFYGELNQSVTLPAGYRTANLASNVVIVTFSEFGRTIRQNSDNPNQAGTDHATCAPQFVVGGSVIGGQYGNYPALDDPGADNEDDLRMTYDFRDFFGTVLVRWLNVPLSTLGPGPGKIFPATTALDDDGRDYTSFNAIPFLAP